MKRLLLLCLLLAGCQSEQPKPTKCAVRYRTKAGVANAFFMEHQQSIYLVSAGHVMMPALKTDTDFDDVHVIPIQRPDDVRVLQESDLVVRIPDDDKNVKLGLVSELHYCSDKAYHTVKGHILGRWFVPGKKDLIVTDHTPKLGMSGAPLLYEGKVVGVFAAILVNQKTGKKRSGFTPIERAIWRMEPHTTAIPRPASQPSG